MSKHTQGYQSHKSYVAKAGKYTGQKINLTKADKTLLRDKGNTEMRKEVATKQYKAERRAKIGSVAGALDGRSIFTIILAFLLLFALIAGLTGTGENRTFAGFLEYLSQFEGIPLDWLKLGSTQIEGDWGLFEFLKNFFEMLGGAFKAVAWFGLSMVNALIFILKLANWLFFGY